MFDCVLILGVLFLILFLLFHWGNKNYDLFEKQGLKYIKPWPFIGSVLDTFKGNGIADRIIYTYRIFPNEKIIGLFDFGFAIYCLRSPDVLKQIAVKDFHHFQDRLALVDESIDEFLAKMLFSMSGKEWRDMRTTLSPMFTGSKMRTMFSLTIRCSEQFVDFLNEDYKENGLTAYRIKDIFLRYTNDVIAACAFGVECNSFKYPDNEVYTIGQGLLQFQKSFKIVNFILMRVFPKIAKLFGLTAIDSDKKKRFADLILGTMDIRKRDGIVRPDLLQMIMKIRDGQANSLQEGDETNKELKILKGDEKRTWTDAELLAQTFIFYGAGLDSSSTVMTYAAYELAINPEIQEKLFNEIIEINESLNGGPLTYEALQKMQYLEMVISEVLRKWPPQVAADRRCNQDYLYKDSNGLQFTIKKGSSIWIPIYAFHMDPKYFPEPEKFDPERFSDENKAKRDAITFMPFGVGPRNCLGMRLAMMNIKTIFYYLLLHFTIKACEETQIPLRFKRSVLGLVPTKEIKLYIEPRNTII